jgi:hypothetical protein
MKSEQQRGESSGHYRETRTLRPTLLLDVDDTRDSMR